MLFRSRGAGGSGAGSGPNVDLSSLTFTPPPSSGERSTQKLPGIEISTGPAKAGAKKTPAPGASLVVEKPKPTAAGKGAGKSLKVAWQKFNEKQIAGLPILFWILAAIGLIAAGGLAIAVINR